MKIIRDGAIVEDDWVHVPAEAGIADLPEGNVIVPLKIWHAEREALLARGGKIGVKLESDDLAEELAADLDHIASFRASLEA